MLTTLALTAAVVALSHSPMIETRAEVFCTAERPCGCPYFVSFCIPTCHTDPGIECGPTHRKIVVPDN
jgi:hypothetical protein